LPISSPRVALACAILWATTAVSATYFPQVFEEQEGCRLRVNGGTWFSEVRVFGRLVGTDEESADGFDAARTRVWRWRVTVSLALVGAILGALVGGHRWWRWRTETTHRLWVWLTASAVAFAAVVLVGLPWSHEGGLFERATDPFLPGHPHLSRSECGALFVEAGALALVAAIIGWGAHTVIVSWGLRPWGRPGADLAADYADPPARFRPDRLPTIDQSEPD
jgi:hypothetical protein